MEGRPTSSTYHFVYINSSDQLLVNHAKPHSLSHYDPYPHPLSPQSTPSLPVKRYLSLVE